MGSQLHQRSRYGQVPQIAYRVYEPGALPGATPLRTDRSFARRYTSWAATPDAEPYTSVPGDTFVTIAHRRFGDPWLWSVVADYNPHVFDPFSLAPGTELLLPPLSVVGIVPSRL